MITLVIIDIWLCIWNSAASSFHSWGNCNKIVFTAEKDCSECFTVTWGSSSKFILSWSQTHPFLTPYISHMSDWHKGRDNTLTHNNTVTASTGLCLIRPSSDRFLKACDGWAKNAIRKSQLMVRLSTNVVFCLTFYFIYLIIVMLGYHWSTLRVGKSCAQPFQSQTCTKRHYFWTKKISQQICTLTRVKIWCCDIL